MPLYDFVCEACQEQSELLVRANDKPTCPKCQSTKMSRQLSVVAAPVVKGNKSSSMPLPQSGGCGRSACAMGGCQGFGD